MNEYKKIRTFTRLQSPYKQYDKAGYFDFIMNAPGLLELNENEELKKWFENQFGLKLEPVPRGVHIYRFSSPEDRDSHTLDNSKQTLTVEIMLENCHVENKCVLEYMKDEKLTSWNPIPYEFIAFDRSLVKYHVSPYHISMPNHSRTVLHLKYRYTEPMVEDEKKGFFWTLWSKIPEFRFY